MSSAESPIGVVAIVAAPGEDSSLYSPAVLHGSGKPLPLSHQDPLPADAGALLVIGVSDYGDVVPVALRDALDTGTPVLGVGTGMHAVNLALGGRQARSVSDSDGTPQRMPVFISPGAKLSYTIAGSGWVTVPFANAAGLMPMDLADNLLISCYREDGFVAAFELSGRNWVIGVQWAAHDIESLPSGFDSLLLALVERAAGVQ